MILRAKPRLLKTRLAAVTVMSKNHPRPHKPHLSPGKPGHSSKHAAQRSLEIFGHVARELAALSEL